MAKTFQTTNGFTVTVDDSDYEAVVRHEWGAHKPPNSRSYYVTRREYDRVAKKTRWISLHRQLMNAPPERWVDHWDGDTLNNRRSNLRYCTNSQNQCNQQVRVDSKTGFRGVDHVPSSPFYRAHIKIDGKKRYLGQFATAREAALAFDNAARSLHGDFARLNLPDIHEQPTRITSRTSKVRGVIRVKTGVFYVRFRIGGKLVQFGTYRDEITAGLAAQAKSIELGFAS